MGGGGLEIRTSLMGVDKNQLVSGVKKQHYITIKEICFAIMFDSMHHLSYINKIFILTQPFNRHLCNICERNCRHPLEGERNTEATNRV